jgi:NitT/TauT family transport system substrate-binding protein
MELAGVPIRRVPMPEEFRTIFSNGFVASEKMINEKPKLVSGMVRAINKSWAACKVNTEACVRAYWEAVPTSRPLAGKEAEQLKTDMRQAMFDRNQLDDFSGTSVRKYGHFPEDAWRRLVKVMGDEGLISRTDLDLTKLYSGRFVDEFNAFDPLIVERIARAAK